VSQLVLHEMLHAVVSSSWHSTGKHVASMATEQDLATARTFQTQPSPLLLTPTHPTM
jgi:hypothetical protein